MIQNNFVNNNFHTIFLKPHKALFVYFQNQRTCGADGDFDDSIFVSSHEGSSHKIKGNGSEVN